MRPELGRRRADRVRSPILAEVGNAYPDPGGRRFRPSAVLARTAGTLRTVAIGPEPTPPDRRQLPVRLLEIGASVLALVLTLSAVNGVMRATKLPVVGALGLCVLLCLPAALAPRRPLMAWRLVWLTTLVTSPLRLGGGDTPWSWHPVQVIVLGWVLFLAAARLRRAVLVWLWLLTVLSMVALVPPAAQPGTIVLPTVVAFVGDQVRSRREVQRALAREEKRSEQEKARRAALEERARIAREMHDLVAHHMSLIAVQAETAQYRRPDATAEIREEFTAIANAARGALTEMRRLLGVLRSETPELARAPQPGLADVDELIEMARRSDVHVRMTVTGTLEPVTPSVGLSAYRIVQEALSNARRHAPGAPVHVELRGHEHELRLRVVNGRPDGGYGSGSASKLPGNGHGLGGMRERAVILGGSFEAGPTDDGGYEVRAVLPRAADE